MTKKEQIEQKRKDQLDIKRKARAIAILCFAEEAERTKIENTDDPMNLIPVEKVTAGMKKTNSSNLWRKRVLNSKYVPDTGYRRSWRYPQRSKRIETALDKLCEEYPRTLKYEESAIVETVEQKDVTPDSIAWANAVIDAMDVPYESGDFEVTVRLNIYPTKKFTIIGATNSVDAQMKATDLAKTTPWEPMVIDINNYSPYAYDANQIKSYVISTLPKEDINEAYQEAS